MQRLPLLTSFLLLSLLATAQKYTPAIEAKIKAVENGLSPQLLINDKVYNLQERMKYYDIPAVSIAVINDYKIEWVRAYGMADKEGGVKATPATLFQAASISKSVNAAGVMRLAQSGKVNLDENINQYLKGWTFPYDTAKGKAIITLKRLLSHTAGTSVHGFRGYAPDETIPTVIQVLNGEKPANSAPIRSLFDAGTKVQYSGGGTTIAQQVVMDVTGGAYDRYMQEQVLQPLGMKTSFYSVPPPADRLKLLATAYREDGKPVKGKFHYYPENAAASLWTNPTELSQFVIALQQSYEGKSDQFLSQQWTQTMMTPVMGDAALGVFIRNVNGEKYFSHGGANEGFRCQYFGSLQGGRGVVVMVNSDNGAILNEVINSVATVYGWKDFYQPQRLTTVTLPEAVLDSYAGTYSLREGLQVKVWREGKSMKAQGTGQGAVELFAVEEGKFTIPAAGAKVEFVKDSNGKVSKFILHQSGRVMEAVRM